MTETVETECACCYTVQDCFDDGEAYICIDRPACQERQRWAARKARARAFLRQNLKKGRDWASLEYRYDAIRAPTGGAGREQEERR